MVSCNVTMYKKKGGGVMYQVVSRMIGFKVKGTDGNLGTVKELYFDDVTWTIRYMAVETGKWLTERKTLVSIAALEKINWATRTFSVNLNREQVRNSPDTDIEKPISRKHELALHRYYAWNNYWGNGFYVLPGFENAMLANIDDGVADEECSSSILKLNPHLRSTRKVTGNRINATDGDIGQIEDFLVNEETWGIRYLIVDTRNWLPGRQVLVSPKWLTGISWKDDKLFADVPRDVIKKSPEFDPSKPFDFEYEEKLLKHMRKTENAAWVTFKFHAAPGSKVYLAGTFNKWNPTMIRLEDDKKGRYSATVLMPTGRNEYKFIVDGNWCNAHDCKNMTPNPFGTTNSVLFIGHDPKGHMHTFSRFSASQNHPMWSTPMGG